MVKKNTKKQKQTHSLKSKGTTHHVPKHAFCQVHNLLFACLTDNIQLLWTVDREENIY